MLLNLGLCVNRGKLKVCPFLLREYFGYYWECGRLI